MVQGDAVWPISTGSLTITPPHVGHELAVDGDSLLTFFYLQFDGEREVAGVLHRLADQQTAQGPLRVDQAAVVEASHLKARLDSASPDRVASGLHGFRAWLYDLAVGRPENLPDGIDRALVWLRQHLDRPLTLEELAQVAGLDRFALCRRFKARTGLSPLAYVHRSKTEAACFLLEGTDLPLTEVALRLGYCDEFHFGKVFKKWRGVPPGRWRRGQSA